MKRLTFTIVVFNRPRRRRKRHALITNSQTIQLLTLEKNLLLLAILHYFFFKCHTSFQGGNSQNFLGKFVRFFITLRCFFMQLLFIENRYFMIYTVVNLKILRPKDTNNLKNYPKMFCEFPSWACKYCLFSNIVIKTMLEF